MDLDPMALAAPIAMGLTLAACAGLRAFLPPLVLGLAARIGLIHLSPDFSWLGSTPVLIALTSATVFELLGDKLPIVDTFMDGAATFLRPAAGGLVALAPLASLASGDPEKDLSPVLALGGMALGASISLAVHLVKTCLRLTYTLATAGIANPFISLLEDLLGISGSVLAILVPVVALLLLLLLLLLFLPAASRIGLVLRRGRGA